MFIFFIASFVNTFVLSIFCNENWFRFLFNLTLLFFYFLIEIINFQNLRLILLFWHFTSLSSIISKELVLVYSIISFCRMFSNCTSWNCLKFFPIIYYFVTASPSFFQIMKNRFSWMIITGLIIIFRFNKFFLATISLALYLIHN